jgi:hypothetical protein
LDNVFDLNRLYHLSKINLDNQIVVPSIPTNYFTKHNFENNTTPRISFSPSIDGCLIGLSQNVMGLTFFVHEPDSYDLLERFKVSIAEVPDAELTQEVWLVDAIKVRKIAKIRVLEAIEPALPFYYNQTAAECYAWTWHFVN